MKKSGPFEVSMQRLAFPVYAFLMIFATLGCGGSGGNSTPPPAVSISISPLTATAPIGTTVQFSASVTGTTNTAVSWNVAGGAANGTVGSSGLYTAPAAIPNPATVTVTAASQADTTKSASAAVTVQSDITVQVFPQAITIQTGSQQVFGANVSGTTNRAVTWSVNGGSANGTIDPVSGLYTAPSAVPNPAQVIVKGTSQADTTVSGMATVTLTAPVPSVVVEPNPENVAVFTTQQFNANVNNLASNAVTWQVNGTTGGSKQFGFINSSGLYVAPGGVPTKSDGSGSNKTITLMITAVSQANPSISGSAVVTIFPPNQNPEGNPITLGASGSNQRDSSMNGNEITCCGGTLGSLVTRAGTQYILSNNHVLARSDLGTKTAGAVLGDSIVQPGLIDTNCGQGIFDIVANLTDFYNLETGADPKIDAAIAQPVPNGADPNGKILFLGGTVDGNNVPVSDAPMAGSGVPETSALLNRAVAKSGRTTGLTCSSVDSISLSVSVQYQKGCGTGATFSETYANQVDILGGSFSAGGDSGSLIVSQDTADPVALLFAGSDSDTVGNPVGEVLNYFSNGGNPMTFVGGGAHQVIGCTLPTAPAAAVVSVPVAAVKMQQATFARDANAVQLLANPEVQALGIGNSLDYPGEAAILFFVTKGQAHTGIPGEVEGTRTRILEGELFAQHGVLTAEQSASMVQSLSTQQSVGTISETEFARAKGVHTANVREWMNRPGVQGVGIGASLDSPAEAALILYLIRGVAHEAIPEEIAGVRVRVRESSRFVAGVNDDKSRRRCPVSRANRQK